MRGRGCVAVIVGGLCAVAAGSGHAPAPDRAMLNAAAAELGVRAAQVVPVTRREMAGGGIAADVTIGRRARTLELFPHASRASGYSVRAQRADGTWADVEPGPARTLRGAVAGVPGSAVAGAWLEDGLYAFVRMPGGRRYWVEPVGRRIGADPILHAVYDERDVIPTGGSCGAEAVQIADHLGGEEVAGGVAGGPTSLCTAELACDADHEYFGDYGNVAAVEDRINMVIDTVNLQYESEVGITHQITTILVRTSEASDPYTQTDPSALLNEFRDRWIASHGNIQRDVAQLFTGKELDGPIVGIAWVGSVCESLGYSVVQSDFDANFNCSTDLSAHELGHNWSAGHCTCPGFTMNPTISCANEFNSGSESQIVGFRNTRTCIECTGALTFDFPDGLPDSLPLSGQTTIRVIVGPEGSQPQPGTGFMYYKVDGGPLQNIPMTETAPNEYEVTFPPFICGSVVDYSFTAETMEGDLVTSPAGAPSNSYMAISASQVTVVFADDFQMNQGWTVQGTAADGAWERDIPLSITVCDRGNPGGDGDGSGRCYLTDNSNVTCDSDVDGGATTLTSPVMDASVGAGLISYQRWFSNATGSAPFEDVMVVEVSDDDGQTWSVLETVGPVGPQVSGGWFRPFLAISTAGIELNGEFRIRFTVSDEGSESIVEAALDAVTLRSVICGPNPDCQWDIDGSGDVDIGDFLALLGAWGPNPGHPADFDLDGEVGISDFLKLLGHWGPCP